MKLYFVDGDWDIGWDIELEVELGGGLGFRYLRRIGVLVKRKEEWV